MQVILALISDRLEAMGYWNRDYLLPPEPILIVAGAMLVGVGMWSLYKAGKRLWKRTEGLRLFNRIAGERGLTMGERWQLWKLSRRRGLATPLTLLVCEATLAVLAGLGAGGKTSEEAARFSRGMSIINRKLFGQVRGD